MKLIPQSFLKVSQLRFGEYNSPVKGKDIGNSYRWDSLLNPMIVVALLGGFAPVRPILYQERPGPDKSGSYPWGF